MTHNVFLEATRQQKRRTSGRKEHMKINSTLISLVAVAALFSKAHANEIIIKTVEKFVEVMNDVNSGNDYADDTVLLDAMLDFADYDGHIEPIGNTIDTQFNGIFNGQGNMIRNLHINTSARYGGLFGYSRGATIKNFMLDESCSITVTHESTTKVFVGSALGKCFTSGKPCIFDNAVNKATITYTGSVDGDIAIGGVIGSCEYSNYYCSIKNCANFVNVVDAGTTNWFSEIGGIAGICGGSEEKRCKLHNCLNYGNLIHKGKSKDTIMGGIVANMYSTTNVQNCVNLGTITNENPGRYNHIGGIAGYAFTEVSSVERNFWSSNSGVDIAVGYNSSEVRTSDNLMTLPSESMINTLNKYAVPNRWDLWALNKDFKTFSLALNGFPIFVSTLEVIHLPDLASYEGHSFSGFFMDSDLTIPMTNFVITEDTTIYSSWKEIDYTIVFVHNETYNETKIVTFAKNVSLPELEPRDGFVLKWCTADNTTCDPARMPPMNLTLYPLWVVPYDSSLDSSFGEGSFNNNASRYVRITFRLENMYTSEVEDVISKYGGESVHEVLTIDDVDLTTVVVIEFEVLEDAVVFVDSIRASKAQAQADKISKVEYLDESLFSAGISAYPDLSLFGLLM